MTSIGFIGMGKLGLPVAVAMASRGADVTGFDIDKKNMSKEPRPYQEAGPDGTGNFDDWLAESDICFAPLQETVADKDIIFVAVQTPHDPLYEGTTPLPDTRADFDYRFLKNAVRAIVPHMTFGSVLAIISTVLPGTIRREILPLVKSESGIGVVYNPSFIAMGVTMTDFLYPEFILIGGDQDWARTRVGDFYRKILPRVPIQKMTLESAELTKVAYNTAISQKIAFANATMEISHYLNGDCDQVIDALSLATKRVISPDYLRGGMGDGGGCHPRDNIAMSWLARDLDLSHDIFEDAMKAREDQTRWLADFCKTTAAKENLPIVIMGFAYKPDSNLTAGSPALLLYELLDHRAKLYDPHVQYFEPVDSVYSRGWRSVLDALKMIGRFWRWLFPEAPPETKHEMPIDPAVFLIGCKHACFVNHDWPEGSVVIDPHRYIPDREGVNVIRIGQHKPAVLPARSQSSELSGSRQEPAREG